MLMPRFQQRAPMTGAQRLMVYSLMLGLWLSGCIWLALEQSARRQDPFGAERNPWEPALLTIHGVLAVAGMYLLGWLTAHHITRWWGQGRRRVSGGLLSGMSIVLIISGFALFFLSDDHWQARAALTHDIVGVAIAVFAIQHWVMFRRGQRAARSRRAV